MIAIINESNEIIPFEDGKEFEVILDDLGYGLYLEDDLIEDYGTEELAVKVMKDVVENIEKGNDYIYMSEIHENLEVNVSVKKYKVEIRESLSRVVEVEAETEEQAIEKVHEMYKNEEIVLDWQDFDGDTEIDIFLD